MCYGAERDYSPCMSACPKTCENFNSYDNVKSNCPYACVEGCSCSDGMVSSLYSYINTTFNNKYMRNVEKLILKINYKVSSIDGEVCMPAEECECKCIDGVSYVDGQKIEHMSDECRSWLVFDNIN